MNKIEDNEEFKVYRLESVETCVLALVRNRRKFLVKHGLNLKRDFCDDRLKTLDQRELLSRV